MENKINLDELKKKYSIDEETSNEIATLFYEIYNNYLDKSRNDGFFYKLDEKFEKEILIEFFNRLKTIQPQVIPYAQLTNAIFAQGYMANFDFMDGSFPFEFEQAMKETLIFYFGDEKEEEDSDIEINKYFHDKDIFLYLNRDDENAIVVFYKIIQHVQLAMAQRDGLYREQKDEIEQQRTEITELSRKITSSDRKYNNMISNFISILGIFAAIMMATFGAVQGFSSIYTNENNYTLTEIILITCIGLMCLILLLFVLMHGVSKLTEKTISSDIQSSIMHRKYPQLFYPVAIILIIFIAAGAHLFSYRTPEYFPDIISDFVWLFGILLLILLALLYLLFIFSVRYNLLGKGSEIFQTICRPQYVELINVIENRNRNKELKNDKTRN